MEQKILDLILFRQYIIWLLLKYQNEAFEIMQKTEIVSVNVFLNEIIPKYNAQISIVIPPLLINKYIILN